MGRPLSGAAVGGTTSDLRGALGIFGGTFDPIHLAHLAVAEAARDDLDLASVTFMPAAQPPHKRDRRVSPVHHRVAMVEAAIADNPRFTSSRIEADRAGPSYTADTLTALAEAEAGPLALILSAEAFAELPTWHDPERILALATLVVAPREGYADADPALLEAALPGVPARVVLLPGPRMRLSASDIRRRAAAGRSLRYLVPDAVATYISDHGLYRAERPARTAARAAGSRTRRTDRP